MKASAEVQAGSDPDLVERAAPALSPLKMEDQLLPMQPMLKQSNLFLKNQCGRGPILERHCSS